MREKYSADICKLPDQFLNLKEEKALVLKFLYLSLKTKSKKLKLQQFSWKVASMNKTD